MKPAKKGLLLLSITVGAGLWFTIWAGLENAGASKGSSPVSLRSTLDRDEDPIVVAGVDFPGFDGDPIAELILYTFSEGIWSPIPFQIDERLDDSIGTYVNYEDGLLDANDELAFMAKDAGQTAGLEWPDDPEARQYERYQVTASDPLNPGDNGYAYLFRSTTLPTSTASYVDWNETLQTVTAVSYTAAFNPASFVGLADLTVNNTGTDILDRQKTRVDTLILDLDEEDLINFITPTISIPVTGPVRGVANGGAFNVSIYGARLDFSVSLDTTIVPIDIDEIRTSFDLNDPAVVGITTFYDSNVSALIIDVTPDVVDPSPRFDWFQVSGSPGGIVAVIPAADAGGGTIANYYKDDDTFDPGDTGDGLSYGDSGLTIVDPGAIVQFSLAMYVLPPDSTANVGAGYFDRATTPLTAATAVQYFGGSTVFMPHIIKPA
jgi:hypothetical protein